MITVFFHWLEEIQLLNLGTREISLAYITPSSKTMKFILIASALIFGMSNTTLGQAKPIDLDIERVWRSYYFDPDTNLIPLTIQFVNQDSLPLE